MATATKNKNPKTKNSGKAAGGFKPGTPPNPAGSLAADEEAQAADAVSAEVTPDNSKQSTAKPQSGDSPEQSPADRVDPQAGGEQETAPPPEAPPHQAMARVGGFAAGEQLTVPDGCVAVVLPVDLSRMNDHTSRHIEINAMNAAQQAGSRALLTGMDRMQLTTANGGRVTRPPACVRWVFEQIDAASGASKAAKKTKAHRPQA